MSIRVMTRVWDHSQHGGTALLLLLKLADHANDEGICWPSIETLERATKVDRSTVQRNLRKVETSGEVVVLERGRGRKPSRYQVVVGTDVEGPQNATSEAAPASPQGPQNAASEAAPVRPKPSGKPPVEPSPNGDPLERAEADEERKRASVKRRGVTPLEWVTATAALDEFNQYAGTAFTIRAHYVPIVGRIREHPELTADEHRGIVAAAFRRPWWRDDPGPQVVYGNARIFEQALERWRKSGGARREAPGAGHPAEPVDGEHELLERLRSAFRPLGETHALHLHGAHLHEPVDGRIVLASPRPAWLRDRYGAVIEATLGPHEVVDCRVQNDPDDESEADQ